MMPQERKEKADVIFIYKFILLPLDVVLVRCKCASEMKGLKFIFH